MISDFRKIVETSTNVKTTQQRLIYKARLLKDEQKLSEFVKEDDDTIHLVVKPEQQPQGPPPPAPEPAQQPSEAGVEGNIMAQLPTIFSSVINQLMPQAQMIASRIVSGIRQNQPRAVISTSATAPPTTSSAPPAPQTVPPESSQVPRVSFAFLIP